MTANQDAPNKKSVPKEECSISENKQKKVIKKQVASKIEQLKEDNKFLTEQIKDLTALAGNLKAKIEKLEIEKNVVIEEFKETAKTFQDKANIKLKETQALNHSKLEKDREYLRKYGAKSMLTMLADHLNNLEIAMNYGQNSSVQEVQNYVAGFQMIFQQILNGLQQMGVERIEPQIGDRFDHNSHESIGVVEKTGLQDKIIEVKKKGYKLHELVITPALVIVGK